MTSQGMSFNHSRVLGMNLFLYSSPGIQSRERLFTHTNSLVTIAWMGTTYLYFYNILQNCCHTSLFHILRSHHIYISVLVS